MLGGYGLSNTARPLIGVAFGWNLVLITACLAAVVLTSISAAAS